MKKRLLALIAALGILVSATACNSGSESSSGGESADSSAQSTDASSEAEGPVDWSQADPITFDVFSQTANFSGEQGGWFGKILKDKFNITLNIISGQGEGVTLFQTRSTAGDLGDIIIFGSNIQNFVDSITAGLLYDMTDLLAGGDIEANYPLAVQRMKDDYGSGSSVYGLPNGVTTEKATTSSEGNDLTFGNYMVWSAYKAAGMPEINTLEDLLPALKAMQEAQPTAANGKRTYGFSLFKDWDGALMSNIKQYSCLYGWDEWGFLYIDATGEKYESILDEDGQYYRNLKLYHEANKMGLLDPDSATQSYTDLTDKMKYGQILCNWWPWSCQGQYNTVENTTKTDDHDPDGYVLIPIADQTIISNGFSPAGINYQICIGSKCEDPERAMALLEWLYSPEGVETSFNGPEGLTWELVDGKPQLTEFGAIAVADPKTELPAEWGGGTYEDGQSKINDFKCVSENGTDPNFGEPYLYSRWSSYSTETDLMKEWSETIGDGAATVHEYLDNNDMVLVAPGTAIQTPVLPSDVDTIKNAVQDIIKTYSWQMVMTTDDAEFDTLWETMVSEAKALGIDQVDAVYIEQWELLSAARKAAAAQ